MSQTPESHLLWSDPAERITSLFKSIHKLYRDQLFEKSRQYGFTGPQMGLLIALQHKPFSTLSEMSEFLGLSKSTVSGIVDRLVAQGAVNREIPEDNRRIVRLSLSEEFRRNNVLADLKKKYISDALKDASREELEKIITGLETLYKLVSRNEQNKN